MSKSKTSSPTIVISCCGSRGDVQPFVAAGQALQKDLNAKVVLIVAKGFMPFVESYGLIAEESTGDLPNLLLTSPEGKAMRNAGLFNTFSAAKDFSKLIVDDLFQDTLKVCKKYDPDLLIVTTVPFFSGCTEVPKLVRPGNPCPVIVAHTVPSSPSREFAPPTTGAGLTSRFGFMNSFYWSMGENVMLGKVYGPLVTDVWERNGLKDNGDPLNAIGFSAPRMQGHQVAYIYSSALLPKPDDWSVNEHVTGFLDIADKPYEPPTDLAEFLNDTSKGPLVYVGIGSMLGIMYDNEQERINQLNVFVNGYNLLSKTRKFRMILHCVGGGGQVILPRIKPDPSDGAFFLTYPVPHSYLFPFCDLIVHHGGAGSTHTSLYYGKPTLVLACGAQSDQPFWGDIVTRKSLGPKSKLLSKVTPEKFASKLEDGLFIRAQEYKTNAGSVGEVIRSEKGPQKFVSLCKRVLEG